MRTKSAFLANCNRNEYGMISHITVMSLYMFMLHTLYSLSILDSSLSIYS